MFDFPLYVLSSIFKGNAIKFVAWGKWLAIACLVAIAGYACYLLIDKVTSVFSDEENTLIQSKAQIAKQEEQIKAQQVLIQEMKKSIEQLKASNEATLLIVKELNDDQKKIEIKVISNKKSIDKSLAHVESLDIPEVEKEKKKSQILIKGLNQTYCELFVHSCTAKGKKK